MPPRKKKDVDFGNEAELKTFYHDAVSNIWTEKEPRQPNPAVTKSHDSVAIKVYKLPDSRKLQIGDEPVPLVFHMIELQSPILIKNPKDILEGEDVFLEQTEVAQFRAPFKPLFFAYENIMALHAKTKSETLFGQHMKLLGSGLISYDLAWTYFPRGCAVFSGQQDTARVFGAIDTNSSGLLVITCEEIAFDGVAFEWKTKHLHIPSFAGNLLITSLTNFPLEFHPDRSGVEKRLTKRAEKVLEYQRLKYCEYEGLASLNQAERHNVHGRILIEYFGYQKHHEGLERSEISPWARPGPTPLRRERPRRLAVAAYEDDLSVYSDGVTLTQGKRLSNYMTVLTNVEQEDNKAELLARTDELIFVSPMLKGFALKNKLWLNFYVDDIKPVNWNDEAWDHLVYDEVQKDLVLTFVDNHQRIKGGIDDVITGKGLGLIVLLSGPPGIGKTLTAEAVADKTQRPLYYLQAQDLGINAATLGRNIKKVSEMATEWDAVIWLDEADVFISVRSPTELMSIFLRELEYFQGIIFLTTNLYSTIDIAFRSRVNIHLLFNSLSPSARRQLWQKFMERLPKEETKKKLPAKDLNALVKWEMNGREIKNSIKTVRNWCLVKDLEMNLARLESGIKSTAPQATKLEGNHSEEPEEPAAKRGRPPKHPREQ